MQAFQIFKPGKHTASSGTTLSFSEDDLRAAVAAYDPAVHEAPIVVGHPRDNGPAYGWVKALDFNDGAITAEPIQVDADFAEMVQAGRFKKRSASWYLPDAPNNPKPGTLYLRHVGFLGAQPPAVKGLKEVAFSEEEGVVEFADSQVVASLIARIARNLREWIISTKDVAAADQVVPDWMVGDLEAQARASDQPDTAAAMPLYSETEDDPMKIEELQAQITALTTERDALKAQADQAASFAEREDALKAREAAVAQAEAAAARTRIEARVEAAVKAGRLLPGQRAHAVNFAAALADGEATLEFGEGDKAEKVSAREHYLRQLEAAPKVVEYGEHAGGSGEPPSDAGDPQALADKARAIVAKAKADGKSLSFTEAVAQVMSTGE